MTVKYCGDLLQLIAAKATGYPSTTVAVAVSGGGDSAALLQVMAEYAAHGATKIIAATVDHGLRAASADEAQTVAATCATLGVPHTILRWTGWDGTGNLQDAARSARYALLGAWALANGCGQVWLGHTSDDQAETFLLRLARGSGVDGLSAMPEIMQRGGINWIRPFLTVSRERLRSFLKANALHWIDDPSNADPRFDRIKFRNAMGSLAELGLTQERLNSTAASMARARVALERMTVEAAGSLVETNLAAEALITVPELLAFDAEIRLRLLAKTLMWVSGATYRPRLESLMHLNCSIGEEKFGGVTLHGCVLRKERGRVVVRRELARVAAPVPATIGIWDGRWKVAGPLDGLTLAALGEAGLAQAEDWRFTRLSREALLTTPGLWRDDTLVAAPVAGKSAGFTATFCREFADVGINR